MAVAFVAAGAWVEGTTSVTPGLPAGMAAGDVMVLFVGCKPFSATIVEPTGWTLIPGSDGADGTVANVGGAGSVLWAAFQRAWQSGDAAPVVTITSGSISGGVTHGYSKGAGTWDVAAAKGSDAVSDTALSLTMDADPGITAGDHLAGFAIIPDNQTMVTPTLTAASATIGTPNKQPATSLSTASAEDLAATGLEVACTAGTATAAAVQGWTLGGAETGGGCLVRLRESAGGGATILRQMLQHHHYRKRPSPAWRREKSSGLYLRAA